MDSEDYVHTYALRSEIVHDCLHLLPPDETDKAIDHLRRLGVLRRRAGYGEGAYAFV